MPSFAEAFIDEFEKIAKTFWQYGITSPSERGSLASALKKYRKYIGPWPKGRMEAFKRDVASVAKEELSPTPITAQDIAHVVKQL